MGYNININQGDKFTLSISAKDADGATLNLSGYALTGKIREQYSSTGYIPFSGLLTSDVSGVGLVELTPAQTSQLQGITYIYDVEAYKTGISGEYVDSLKLLQGYAFVFPEATY